jgi:hypothetical protein
MLKRLTLATQQMTPARGIMFLLGMGLVLWGVWVGNPMVATFNNPFYLVLSEVATESAWSAMALVAGITTVVGVVRRDPFLVRTGALLGFLFWLTVSIMYGIADPTITPVITNFVLALLHAWIYMQIKLRPETIYQNVEVVRVEGTEK